MSASCEVPSPRHPTAPARESRCAGGFASGGMRARMARILSCASWMSFSAFASSPITRPIFSMLAKTSATPLKRGESGHRYSGGPQVVQESSARIRGDEHHVRPQGDDALGRAVDEGDAPHLIGDVGIARVSGQLVEGRTILSLGARARSISAVASVMAISRSGFLAARGGCGGPLRHRGRAQPIKEPPPGSGILRLFHNRICRPLRKAPRFKGCWKTPPKRRYPCLLGRVSNSLPPQKGAVEKVHRRSALDFTPPLRGESTRQGRSPQASWWGGHSTE